MKNTLTVEYCEVSKDIRCKRNYNPVDITRYCNIPLLYGKRLDDVLDFGTLELVEHTPTPLEPTARIIFRINEQQALTEEPAFDDTWVIQSHETETKKYVWATCNYKGCKKIYSYTRELVDGEYVYSNLNKQLAVYRVVDYDTPVQISTGARPRYKHTIKLIEPTKIIERQDCDNQDVTHTIVSSAYDTVKETVDYSSSQSVSGSHWQYWWGSIEDRGYANNHRFKQPYVQGNSIDLNPRLKIVGRRGKWGKISGGSMMLGGVWGTIWSDACTLSLSRTTIETPAGATVNVTGLSSYILSQAGTYKVTQRYTGSGSGRDYTYYATWKIIVWSSAAPSIKKKTITGVIDRLLATAPLRRNGLDGPRYQLNANLRETFNNISSPEFTFTLGHLMDNLTQVGGFIHAIPRLMPNEYIETDNDGNLMLNDWQNWNIIDFDFLGEDVQFVNEEFTSDDRSWSIDDYASNFVSNIENALQTNFRTYTSAVEPFIGGFMSPRTEDTSFIINDNNCCLKLNMLIYRVLDLTAYANGTEINLTDYIAESTKYNTLDPYSTTGDSKAVKLFYTKGSNIISGFGYEPDTALDIVDGMFDLTAIRNITGFDGNIKDLAFRVTYIPYRNFKARQYKMLTGNTENSTLFYNQQANVVDIEAYGESMKGALLRTGNKDITRTFYFKSFEDIPDIGMVWGDGYYIFSITVEVYNSIYKATIGFSKDFNKLNEYLGIKSDYRQFEISENESANRNPDYGEFCLLSTTPDTQEIEDNAEEYPEDLTSIIEYLSSVGWQNYAITEMKNKLSYINGSGSQGEQLSFVYVETESTEYDSNGDASTVTHKILLPVSCFSFGNSLLFHCQATDNYAAGTTVQNIANTAKAVEKWQKYSDFYGNIDTMKFAFGVGLPSNNLGDVETYSKKLCNFADYELKTDCLVADFREYPFWIDKDSRETISLTYQLHFVTDTTNVQIGKSMSEIWGLVGDKSTTLRVVEFYKIPSKFNNQVYDTTTIKEIEYTTEIEQNNDFKRLKITAPQQSDSNCVGWGILTNDNHIVCVVSEYKDLYLQFRHTT